MTYTPESTVILPTLAFLSKITKSLVSERVRETKETVFVWSLPQKRCSTRMRRRSHAWLLLALWPTFLIICLRVLAQPPASTSYLFQCGSGGGAEGVVHFYFDLRRFCRGCRAGEAPLTCSAAGIYYGMSTFLPTTFMLRLLPESSSEMVHEAATLFCFFMVEGVGSLSCWVDRR